MLDLGPDFEAAIAAELGIDPAAYVPGSLDISLVNLGGSTTVRFTQTYSIDTPTLQGLIGATLSIAVVPIKVQPPLLNVSSPVLLSPGIGPVDGSLDRTLPSSDDAGSL